MYLFCLQYSLRILVQDLMCEVKANLGCVEWTKEEQLSDWMFETPNKNKTINLGL